MWSGASFTGETEADMTEMIISLVYRLPSCTYCVKVLRACHCATEKEVRNWTVRQRADDHRCNDANNEMCVSHVSETFAKW